MKKQVKLVLAIVAAVAVASLTVVYMMSPVAVDAAPVSADALYERFSEEGSVLPGSTYTVSAGETGVVSSILFEVGREVKTGDTLLIIDDAESRRAMEEQLESLILQLEALSVGSDALTEELTVSKEQLRQQLAASEQQYNALFGANGTAAPALASAKSAYNLAQSNYNGGKLLYDSGSISEMELRTLEEQLNTAESALKAATYQGSSQNRSFYQTQISSIRAQLSAMERGGQSTQENAGLSAKQLEIQIEALRDKLNKNAAISPIDGIVGEVLTANGEYVTEYQPVAVIYGKDETKIVTDVLEEDAFSLKTGNTAVCVLANGVEFDAKIIFVSPITEERTSSVGLAEKTRRIELKPLSLPTEAGAGSRVDITFASVIAENTLSVPSGAIVPYEKGSAVYVVRGGRLDLVPVQAGLRSSGRVQITSGLQDGDIVVTDPYQDGVTQGARVDVSID